MRKLASHGKTYYTIDTTFTLCVCPVSEHTSGCRQVRRNEKKFFMIQAQDIKAIFAQIPAGTTLTVQQIQDLVKNSYPLSPADWEPYTETRNTSYTKWQHQVQSVLAELKRNGIAAHNGATHSYTF